MLNWFFIAIPAPFLWAIVNHIDKYLITRFGVGIGIKGLITFTALFSIILLPIAYLINPHVLAVPIFHRLVLIFSGCLYVIAILFYLYTLNEGETSAVIPMYQLIPVFAYFLGFFILKERLSLPQIIAAVIIIAGAILISLDFSKTSFSKFKKKLLIFLVISSFFFALYEIVFKIIAINQTFWVSSFWQYLGISLTGVFFFFCFKSFRSEFLLIFKVNKKWTIFFLNILVEILTTAGNLLVSYALLLAPVALVLMLESFQPFFVFILGVIMTIFLSRWVKEDLSKKVLAQKITAIVIILTGSYLLYFY